MKILNTCTLMALLGVGAYAEQGFQYGAIRVKSDFAETVAHTFDYEFFNFFNDYPYLSWKNPDYETVRRKLPLNIKDEKLTLSTINGDKYDFRFNYSALKQSQADFAHVSTDNIQIDAQFTIQETGEVVTVKGPIKDLSFNFPIQWDWDFKTDLTTEWGDLQISGTEDIEKVKQTLNLWIEAGFDSVFWYDQNGLERISKKLELSYTAYMPVSNIAMGNRYNDKYLEAGFIWPAPPMNYNKNAPLDMEEIDFGALQLVFNDKLFISLFEELQEVIEDPDEMIRPQSVLKLIDEAGYGEEASQYMTCETVRQVIPSLCPKSMGDMPLDMVIILDSKEVLSRLEDWEGPQYQVLFQEDIFVIKAVFGFEIHTKPETGKGEVLRKITAPMKMKYELTKVEGKETEFQISIRQVEFYDVTVFDNQQEEMDNEKTMLQSTFNLALARIMMEIDQAQFDLSKLFESQYYKCWGYTPKNPSIKFVEHALVFQFDYEPATYDRQLCEVELAEKMANIDTQFEDLLDQIDEVDDIASFIKFAQPFAEKLKASPSPTEYDDLASKVREENKDVIEDL